MRVLILGLIALAIIPIRANSQTAVSGSIPVSSAQSGSETRIHAASGPTIESAAVGIRPAASNDAAVASQSKARRGSGVNHDVALMVVGGAAMVAGAIIGGTAGTIFLVAGALVGLYGLFNFLQ